MTRPRPISSFWERIITAPSGCWIWQGGKNTNGYGSVSYKGKVYLAHRFAWELSRGPIPKGLNVLHHCDNPPCCNPDHLFLGTTADNNADRHAKGRSNGGSQPGEICPHAKLTNADAEAIRARYIPRKVSQAQLAREYGVSRSAIQLITSHKTFRDTDLLAVQGTQQIPADYKDDLVLGVTQ